MILIFISKYNYSILSYNTNNTKYKMYVVIVYREEILKQKQGKMEDKIQLWSQQNNINLVS